MVQRSQGQPPGMVLKSPVNNGKNYHINWWTPDFCNHQQWVSQLWHLPEISMLSPVSQSAEPSRKWEAMEPKVLTSGDFRGETPPLKWDVGTTCHIVQISRNERCKMPWSAFDLRSHFSNKSWSGNPWGPCGLWLVTGLHPQCGSLLRLVW